MDKLDKIYEICAEHFKEMPCSIQYVPIKYLNEELCIAALANSKRTEADEYRKWIQIVSANSFCLKDVPEEKRDFNLCKIAIENEGLMLKYVPSKLRVKMLCDIAVRNNPDAIVYVPPEIRTDVIELVKNSYQYVRILFSDSKFKDYFI